MKRRAVFGQWKTPPQVLYPSSTSSISGMKKSTSMPAFGSSSNQVFDPPFALGNAGGVTFDDSPDFLNDIGYSEDDEAFSPVDASSSKWFRGTAYNESGDNKRRSSSYQDLQAQQGRLMEDCEAYDPSTHVHTKGKRSVHELSKPGKYTNPRTQLLVSKSYGDLRKFEDEDPESRNKRLARNRAAAKMRRVKRKIMVDLLAVEVEDLIRAIEYFSMVTKYRETQPGAPYGLASYPYEAHEEALLVSAPFSKLTEKIEIPNDKHPNPLAYRMNQLRLLDIDDLNHIFLQSLISTKTQDSSISAFRRNRSIQLFLDALNLWIEYTREACLQNSALYVLGASDDDLSSSVAQSRVVAKNRHALWQEIKSSKSKIGRLAVNQSHSDSSSISVVVSDQNGSHTKKDEASVKGINPYPYIASQQASPSWGANPEKLQRLRESLRQRLNLSPDQKDAIKQLALGLRKEQLCVNGFSRVAMALASRNNMDFPCVEQVEDGFRGVLTQNQMNKFYEWAKSNSQAISSLEFTSIEEESSRDSSMNDT